MIIGTNAPKRVGNKDSVNTMTILLIYRISWYKALEIAWTLLLILVDASSHEAKASKPLLITRLRHDPNILQLLRTYQQQLPYEEFTLERRIKVNQSNEMGETQELDISYYVNDELEADELTHDHLVVGSFHHAYISRMFRAYVYTYNSKEDRRKSSDKRLVSRQRCERDLGYLVDNLPGKKRNINPELAAFYDGFGRSESGLLYGNFYWLGSSSQCEQRLIIEPDHQNQNNSIVFSGRYCKASIKSPTWDKLIRYQRDKLARNYFKYEGQANDYERFFRIQVGICLPQSCDSEAIDWAQDQIKELVTHWLDEPYNGYDLVDLFCLPDETSELRKMEPMGWLLLLLYSLWLGAMCVATFLDHQVWKEEAEGLKSNLEKFINSMSFKRNWRRMTSLRKSTELVSEKPAPCDLAFINFIKATTVPLMILGHLTLLIFEYRKMKNIYVASEEGHFYHFYTLGLFFVEGFFFFSGFASSYIMFQQRLAKRFNLFQWLYVIFHRYLRLLGLYAVVYWYVKYVQVYTNHGPNWDYGTSNTTHVALCRAQIWWYPLTLTTNFKPLHDDCIITSYYLANDMQLFLFTPLIIVALHKWTRVTYWASLGAICLGFLFNFRTLYTSQRILHLNLVRITIESSSQMGWNIGELYQLPWLRFTPYLIGLLIGHYTYMVLSGQWKSILYKKTSATNWLLQLLLIFSLIPFFIMFFTRTVLNSLDLRGSAEQVRLKASFVQSIRNVDAGISLAAMSVAIMFGAAPRLRRFMSRPEWSMIAGLNYAIMLIQVDVIWFLYLGREYTLSPDDYDVVTLLVAYCPIIYLISAILTLTIAQPMAKLEQEFMVNALVGDKNVPKQRVRQQQQKGLNKKSN